MRTHKAQRAAKARAEEDAAAFNEAHPIGTPVLFWPMARRGEGRPSKTRTPAWAMGGMYAAVSVDDYPGGILLTHVEVVAAKAEEGR